MFRLPDATLERPDASVNYRTAVDESIFFNGGQCSVSSETNFRSAENEKDCLHSTDDREPVVVVVMITKRSPKLFWIAGDRTPTTLGPYQTKRYSSKRIHITSY